MRRGIGSIDYFDRYMVFGVPDDDLPEHAFDIALQQLADGCPGAEADELLLRLADDTQRITRRIQYKRTTGAALPATALLTTAADQYGRLSAAPQGPLGLLTADRAVDFLAADLLSDLAEDERPAVLETMAATPDGAVLAARTLQRVIARAADSPNSVPPQSTAAWVSAARLLISREITRHLTSAANRPVRELTELETTLIWAWRHTKTADARTWINQRLDAEWAPLDLLAALLPDDRAPFPVIDDDTLQSLDTLIGLDELYIRLAPLLDAPAAQDPAPDEKHREHILQALREHRARAHEQTP